MVQHFLFKILSFILIHHYSQASSTTSPSLLSKDSKNILTVGSLNADTFLTVHRLPKCGENLTTLPSHPPLLDIPGGKGCNQAIAISKLSKSSNKSIFWGHFGNDSVGDVLKSTLEKYHVDHSPSRKSQKHESGRGYVFVEQQTGMVSAVVSGGSNMNGWEDDINWITPDNIVQILKEKQCAYILLQREIPEHVNYRMAQAAKSMGVTVLQDVGGEDRSIEPHMLQLCDYVMPNESELRRLVEALGGIDSSIDETQNLQVPEINDPQLQQKIKDIIPLAQTLQKHGANHILVTLGESGSLLLPKSSTQNIVYQPACKLPSHIPPVDETGAGDCFRAAFAVALSECTASPEEISDDVLRKCMQLASAAGALAVTVPGAVPSIPSRLDVDALYHASFESIEEEETINVRGGSATGIQDTESNDTPSIGNKYKCPLQFGSRLNSMKDQPHLAPTHPQTVRGWVSRQSTIRGLDLVDFNYPQHFQDWTVTEAKQALDEADLKAGSVCLRYPHTKFQLGAMTHPDPKVRQEAIDVTKEAAAAAIELGCDEVVVWSAYDGYDYPFQVNHDEKWDQIIHAFQECCDAYPNIKFSLEYKPTDENTRFFTVPSTGAAVLLVQQINRPNMGLTLDVGHMLMSGENPGQSIALAGKKLFGVQLNDGYTRLAAEDGLMFGSVHPTMALETLYYLQKIGFGGHLYFDTFPQRTDPVKECEYNIQRVKEFWIAAQRIRELGVETKNGVMDSHDALGALDLMEEALAFAREHKDQ